MTSLGKLINEYRQYNNLSVRQFANMCGLSSTYIAKIEKNDQNKTIEPTLYALGRISSCMGLSITELMYFIENHQGIEFRNGITGGKTKIILIDNDKNLGIYYSTIIPNKGEKINRYNQLYIIKDVEYNITDKLNYIKITIKEVEEKKTV